MIIDKLENAHLYANISGKIAKALEILKAGEMAKNQDGQYEVEGEDKMHSFIALIQPALTLIIGGMVGLIAVTMMSAMTAMYGQGV